MAPSLEFLEKTGEPVPGEINAGAYVLERSVLDLIPPGREVSIEREVFPRLVGDGLSASSSTATGWTSAPRERYLQASWDILEGRVETRVRPTAPGSSGRRRGRGRRRRVRRPPAVVSAGCSVAAGAKVRDSVLLDGCAVGAGAGVERLGPRRRALR